LGLGASAPARADDPEVCGYVRYSTSTGPTSTVPMTYCERPCSGNAVGMGIPPGHVGAVVSWEAFVCARRLVPTTS